ncbi:MAG TPA: protein kinase [Polyangiales bacterium]|nr:protein kinase [Polyangiales bacterium]
MSSVAPSEALPARIGARYDVLDRLGRGGMAVVYRVRDRSSPGELALKQLLLPGSSRDRETRALFEREFQVLSQLRHPNVVGVRDYGVDVAGPYYTMELVSGGDLSTHAPWAFRDACQVMMQVCSLLSLLHARGFVHRDITPRNVRLTPDGSAKLIDFGAMVPFGPCLQAVGTPGFVAPEVVHHLRLDARTDLFSVGASLYYALTGQRPFAARSLAELVDVWRREPTAPSALVPEIPSALDALILSLLQVDPARRPNSAFEVMQRLSALSGKPLADSAEVARAYLSTPLLIGRDSQTRRFRQSLQHAAHAEGGGILFEGASGSGRSRLLSACALEAQTSGAIVLRAGGRAARPEAFACASLLAEQLLAALPDDARAHALELGVAERLFQGQPLRLRAAAEWAADAAGTQAALQQWLKCACRAQPLVIVVDDVECIDSASLALLLTLLSEAEETRLLVVGALQTPFDAEARPELAVLRSYCAAHDVPALDGQQTEQLFGSIFADAPRTALLSDRVHKLAAGNPRAAMALVQHLLDRAMIRYADGNWILPAVLAVSDLPTSGQDALRLQIDQLSPLARQLARAQALALEVPWSRSDYIALLPDGAEPVEAALGELVRQGLLVEDGGSYALAHPDVRVCLSQPLTAAERADVHRALATMCARTSSLEFLEAHHWLAAGDDERGLDRLAQLLARDVQELNPRSYSSLFFAVVARTFERACNASRTLRRPPRETCELTRRLLMCYVLIDDERFDAYAPTLLQQLERDSGLADYRALSNVTDPQQRLQRALTAASERYASTSPEQRVYRLDEAIKHLTNYVVISIVIGNRTRNTRLHASLPELLEPFASLSPALHAIWQNALSVTEITCLGRLEQAHTRALAVYRGLEPVSAREVPYVDEIRRAVAYAAAGIETVLGYPTAEAWIALIEDDPLHQVSTLQLRRQLSVFDGDLEAAERYRKRAELVAAQASSRQMFESASELFLHVHLRDLAGVKHAADRIALFAARWPGWRPVHQLAQGYYHRLRGDLPAALAAFERTIAIYDRELADRPASELMHLAASQGCMTVLEELGQLEAARELGLALVRRCKEREITCSVDYLRALAVIEAKLGDHESATARLDALLVRSEKLRPSFAALDYEARARIAILAKDATTAGHYMRLALEHGAADGATGRLGMHGRLLDEARKQGLDLEVPVSNFETNLEVQSTRKANARFDDALRNALAITLEPSARARRALELLCRELNASAGQLYFARGLDLTRSASLTDPDPALDRFAAGYWKQRQLQATMTTVFTTPEQAAGLATGSWTSSSGKQYALLPLSPEGEAECLGLAAIITRPDAIPIEYWELAAAISCWLQELGDVEKRT